jgi:hypothetical protein
MLYMRPDVAQQWADDAQKRGYKPAPFTPPSQPYASSATPQAPRMDAYRMTPPKGARSNDLSGQVPANQMWAQAYNQGAQQFGGNARAQSWTMPGSYSTQSFNPSTGQFSKPTGGQSWDGNMAYNAIDSRPGPITAQATGVGGNQLPWQDALRQREAFVGNLLSRLNEYTSGQRTGPVTFDRSQLLSQADDQLAKGTFFNPFSAPQPAPSAPPVTQQAAPRRYDTAVQGAMDNATQFMRGTQWQNPFGNSWQANNPLPTWGDEEYDARKLIRPEGTRRELDPRFQRR